MTDVIENYVYILRDDIASYFQILISVTMPKCMLRVTGATRKVHQFLKESSLEPLAVYYKGDPGFPESRGPVKFSGFNIALSASHGDSIERQTRQALDFFKKNRTEMERLRTFNFKSVDIDFGLYDLSNEDKPWPSYRLSKFFLETVGALGFEIVISFYGPCPART